MNAIIHAATVAATAKSDAAAAYPAIMNALADTFEALSSEQWKMDTECTGWTVRHMAAHLLGAQEDALAIPTVLWRRMKGRRRYPHLSLLDAANQVQIDDHAQLSAAELCAAYRANVPRVARRVGSFPYAFAGMPVDKTMAPGNTPLRLGYLFNVIYLRDAWMHGFDLARATGRPRVATAADSLVAEQIVRDSATAWGEGSAVDLELTGEMSGTWQLGNGLSQAWLRTDGIDLCRSLAGRHPGAGVATVSGDPALAGKLERLRILF